MNKKPELMDNTIISAYKRCPRYYYYRHVRSWVHDGKKPAPLVFGSAWHEAMDVVWALQTNGNRSKYTVDEVVEAAHEAFIKSWVSDGYPDPYADDSFFGAVDLNDLEPRTPMNAHEMLYQYISARRHLFDKCELIAIERPFIVPVSLDLGVLYIGKLDKLVKFEGRYSSIEHKTTTLYSTTTGIRQSYIDSYQPNSQVDGYFHALRMLHGDEAGHVMVDISLVHKKVHDKFHIQPIRKIPTKMDEFLQDVQYWIAQIKQAHETGYYAKQTGACFDFMKPCSYHELCKGKNFEQIKEDPNPPPFYKVEEWNPVEELHINLDEVAKYSVEE